MQINFLLYPLTPEFLWTAPNLQVLHSLHLQLLRDTHILRVLWKLLRTREQTTLTSSSKLQIDTVRLVSYSPNKRKPILAACEKKYLLKIQASLSLNKRCYTFSEEYTIPKHAKIEPCETKFFHNEELDNHLHTFKEALQSIVYKVVDKDYCKGGK